MKITRTLLKHELECIVFNPEKQTTEEMNCVVYNPAPGHTFREAAKILKNSNLELLKILNDKVSSEKREMELSRFILLSKKTDSEDLL